MCHPLGLLQSKTDDNKCRRECGEIGTLARCSWERKMVRLLWLTGPAVLRVAIRGVSMWPGNPTPESRGTRNDACSQDNCTRRYRNRHVAASPITVKKWKWPKRPSTDQWIHNCKGVKPTEYSVFHTMEWIYCIPYNGILLNTKKGNVRHAETQMIPENTLPHGKRQPQRTAYYTPRFRWNVRNRRTYRNRQ